LFYAIVLDFDLSVLENVQQFRDTLETLKAVAEEQASLPFDPSGTGCFAIPGIPSVEQSGSEHSASRAETIRSQETDVTSLQSDFSSLTLEPKHGSNQGDSNPQNSQQDTTGQYFNSNKTSRLGGGLDSSSKTAILSEMFPSIDLYTITHTLKKCNEDMEPSMDLLLNLSFFEKQETSDNDEKVVIPRGIDGFADGSLSPSIKRKGKRKEKRPTSLRTASNSDNSFLISPPEASTINKWSVGREDIQFIHARTSPVLNKKQISSAYHSNGASLPATINYLGDLHSPKNETLANENLATASQLAELLQEFPTLPPSTLVGLLAITKNSISAARELTVAMVSQPVYSPISSRIEIKVRSPTVEEDTQEPVEKYPISPRSPLSPLCPQSTRILSDYVQVESASSAHFSAGAEAFSKATAAYRRGKSDHLMGGAAAYYSAVGRDHLEKAKKEASMAAHALVASQSTPYVLDLHGVGVHDAVRIAEEGVNHWWESLGDLKYTSGGGARRHPYRIITGLGRHSRDGTSRLGPAVGKMLAKEGWKFEVVEGYLLVTGAVRRH
jgi:hypothetical protein